MSKSVSSIYDYDSIENPVPFYPDVAYSQPKDRKELELDKMREDAMFLKRTLDISYEQVLRWLRNVATKLERNECEGAMGKQLSNCEEEERNRLIAICRRYSLSVAGEATCSQETLSSSPKEQSDITSMKQVRTTKAEGEGKKVNHVTQEVQVEVPNVAVRVALNTKEKTMINEEYWEAYYGFWDDFVKKWFNQRKGGYTVPQDEISKEYANAVANLVFDELPNPYFGDPKNGVDAVIINLNPGGSEKDANKAGTDATQFYSNLKYGEHGKGWLMWKFVQEAGCSYRGFIGNNENLLDKDGKVVNWSQLNPVLRGRRPEVCGVKWWQGTNPRRVGGKRIPWLTRIYQNQGLTPEEVFALELCPYHSAGFGFKKAQLMLLSFINQRVIVPAATAVVENRLPFAVAIGKAVADVLDSGIGTFRKEWSYEMPDWPQDGLRRTYRLYDVSAQDGSIAQIVVTWAVNNRGIPAPGPAFQGIERQIYDLAYDLAIKSGRAVEKPNLTPQTLPDRSDGCR